MSVVGHDNATEENGHDAREMETLCQEVGAKRKQEPHGKLKRVVLTKVHKLEKLEEGKSHCDVVNLGHKGVVKLVSDNGHSI